MKSERNRVTGGRSLRIAIKQQLIHQRQKWSTHKAGCGTQRLQELCQADVINNTQTTEKGGGGQQKRKEGKNKVRKMKI